MQRDETGRFTVDPLTTTGQMDDHHQRFWDSWRRMDDAEQRRAEEQAKGDMQRNLDSAKASLTEQRNALLADAGDESLPQEERDRLTEQADAVGELLAETERYWQGQIAGTHDEDGRWIPRSSGAGEGHHADPHVGLQREGVSMNDLLRRMARGHE